MINEDKAPFFKKALTLAKEAFESDEVPVGAMIVLNSDEQLYTRRLCHYGIIVSHILSTINKVSC